MFWRTVAVLHILEDSPNRVFQIIDNVYDESTLQHLQRAWPASHHEQLIPALRAVPQLGNRFGALTLDSRVYAIRRTPDQPAEDWHIDGSPAPRTHLLKLMTALDDMTADMSVKRFVNDHGPILLRKNQGILYDGQLLHQFSDSSVPTAPLVYQLYHL